MNLIKSVAVVLLVFMSFSTNADVPGTYDISSESPMGVMKSVLIINKDGTGSLDGMMGKIEFSEATISDESFDFTVTAETPMGHMDMTYTGVVNGDDISGEIENLMGGNPFSGNRR
ncbi:MAG TPA: hypothetical protein DCY55_05385 [Gammaproteobacteria bacterium]|nr:hypothetical protein [Gammaproteobacteria bacterium]